MKFGNPNVFAVQLELDPDYGGSWLFGRFCYWINSTEVGDYALGTSLRDLFFNMKWIAHDRGKRSGNGLCHLSPHEVFLLLDNSLYGDQDPVTDLSLPEAPARFDVRPPLDIFDSWKVYLVECEVYDLMLYRKTEAEDPIRFFHSPGGTFDTVIMESYDYLKKLVESGSK